MEPDIVHVAAVSYLNTLPMVYGLRQPVLAERIQLALAVPSLCAQLFKEHKVDLALLPVGALIADPSAIVLPRICIGARAAVESVCILSHVPLASVKRIYLDPDSRTSVLLARILLSRYWDLQPRLDPLSAGQLERGLKLHDAVLLIGDKVFAHRDYYAYSYDLAQAWHEWTGFPMVFAVWATHKPLREEFLALFFQALDFGIAHIAEALQTQPLPPHYTPESALHYLQECIDYTFDPPKEQTLQRYRYEAEMLTDAAPLLYENPSLY